MRKLMVLAATVAMAMLLAVAPAMADVVLRSTAEIDQSNVGSQVAFNEADQDATASQYQYNPGGDATQDNSLNIDEVEIDLGSNRSL
jgi:hypothetical protein